MKALYFILGVSPMFSNKEDLIAEFPNNNESIIEMKEDNPNFNFCWPYRKK